MDMNSYGEYFPLQCLNVNRVEDTWNVGCPFSNRYNERPNNACFGYYNAYNPSTQCYRENARANDQCGYYSQQECYGPAPSQFQPQPVPNLPCNQNQQWDYNSMCFNVDGQPCQYTNVVDLEDFMNNEKRKEKSREAARCRRTKETQIFNELTSALPAKKEEVEQLDKASVMRLAISYLRVRDVASMLPTDNPEQTCLQSPKGLEEVSSEQSYMQALDGFVLVFSEQGDIVYCSENIAEHLGVSQMEMMGQSVFEFSHPCDHDEIRDALRSSGSGRRELLVRFKCTLTSKGRNVHLKSASYKVIRVTGHMLGSEDKADEDNKPTLSKDKNVVETEKKLGKVGSLVAVGRPIPHPSNIEVPLDSKTFLTKHSLDMKITYTDEALMKTFGFEPDELNGHSLYDYHHAADSASLVHLFKSLFSKGQCETGQYRFLAKTGGYAWVQTQATVITDKQQKPISVVCVNYVISGIECKDEVFAAHQVHNADLKPKVLPVPIETCEPTEVANGAIVSIIPTEKERPIPVTKLIFAPRQKEMNKGFLMFSQDEGQTMLKDDPDDLSHLAPTAGDACIPLGNSPFEFLDEFELLNNSYCPIWGEDLPNGSPVDSLPNDSLLLSSPEPHETDSSCEKSSLLTDLSLDPFDNNRSDNEDGGQTAFIPSSDELPVLEPAVMWGALPDNVSLAKPQPSEVSPTSPHSPALHRLLAAPPTGPLPQDLITNIYSDQGLIPSRSLTTWETGVKRAIMKEDDEPYVAKRVKRCPSPAKPTTSTSSSSVLMNLLDMQLKASRQLNQKPNNTYVNNIQNTFLQIPSNNIPLPVINIIHTMPNNQELTANTQNHIMSPLSVNINSMYSLPSSPITPNYSPALSPAPRDCGSSAYSTPQSLSPAGRQLYSPNTLLSPSGAIHGSDPYLNKMQVSPNYQMQVEQPVDLYMELSMSPPDFWNDTEMMQVPNDLISEFDDVKLV